MAKTVLSTKGQLILPAEIRAERNLKPGTEFEVHSTPLGIFIVEIPKDPVKALSGLMKDSGIKEDALKKMRQKDERIFRKKFGI